MNNIAIGFCGAMMLVCIGEGRFDLALLNGVLVALNTMFVTSNKRRW